MENRTETDVWQMNLLCFSLKLLAIKNFDALDLRQNTPVLELSGYLHFESHKTQQTKTQAHLVYTSDLTGSSRAIKVDICNGRTFRWLKHV